MEKRFIENYVRSGDVPYSAKEAGYSAPQRGYQLLEMPQVRAAIDHRRQTRKQLDEAAPLFVEDLVERLAGRRGGEPTHADSAKLQAVFWKAYYGTEGARPLTDREASEMTGDELHQILGTLQAEADRIEAEMAGRARTIAPIEVEQDDVFD